MNTTLDLARWAPPRPGRTVGMWLLAAAGVFALGGCQLPLAIMEKMFPMQTVPAQFNLPADTTVLVFPDDVSNPVTYPAIKRRLAESVTAALRENRLVREVVPYEMLANLRNSDVEFDHLAVASVGRKLDADLVIYVSIDDFSLKDTPIATLWTGRFSTKVRVVDVEKGRLWPDDRAGFPLAVGEPTTENPSETYGEELSRTLADKMAEQVAGLFFEHKVSRHKPPSPAPLPE